MRVDLTDVVGAAALSIVGRSGTDSDGAGILATNTVRSGNDPPLADD